MEIEALATTKAFQCASEIGINQIVLRVGLSDGYESFDKQE